MEFGDGAGTSVFRGNLAEGEELFAGHGGDVRRCDAYMIATPLPIVPAPAEKNHPTGSMG